MRANPLRGLPQSRYFSTTSLTTGRKKRYSRSKRLSYSARNLSKWTKTVLPRVASANVDICFGPNMEPGEVIDKFKRHLARKGFEDIEVTVRDNYTWSKTGPDEDIVERMVGAYRRHGVEPEIWPMATWAAPYFVFSRILRLPLVSGGMGHGSRQHSPDEYMTVDGLRDFEKFVATFLGLLGR